MLQYHLCTSKKKKISKQLILIKQKNQTNSTAR